VLVAEITVLRDHDAVLGVGSAGDLDVGGPVAVGQL